MTELKIEIKIDGTQVTQSELAKVQELRIKHVLQEMKVLGGDIEQTLTEINYLSYTDAKALLLDTKAKYADLEAMKSLYKEPLAAANDFWKSAASKSNGNQDLQEGKVFMHIEGISMQQL